MNKKAVVIVILILILLGLIFLLNRFVAKQDKQETVEVVRTETVSVAVEKPVVVAETPQVETPQKESPKAQIFGKQPTRKTVFMGNRGFLIKDKISTFIKPSILAELKKNNYLKEIIEN